MICVSSSAHEGAQGCALIWQHMHKAFAEHDFSLQGFRSRRSGCANSHARS